MFPPRCIALAFIGVCAAINIRHGAQMKTFGPPTVTHLINDPIGALGGDSVGSVAQAVAGPQVDGAIAKQLEMLTNNPFDGGDADPGNEDLKEVHSKIQSYLGKLDKLYAIAKPKQDNDTPKHLVEKESANATSDDEEEPAADEGPDIKLPQLRKAVLTAAIKKAASSALQAADSKMKESQAAEEARHTAAVQNLTSIALKEKASKLTANWHVQQAFKAKRKAREALTKLQTHEMKTQMAINTLAEHDKSVKADIEDASQELKLADKTLQDRMKAYRAQDKLFRTAQDNLLEEKATQIQALFEKQANGDADNKEAPAQVDSRFMERFLSARK